MADFLTALSDLFIRGWVTVAGVETRRLETDTHWRAVKGAASFNYRLKFPLLLSRHRDPEEAEPRLTLQVAAVPCGGRICEAAELLGVSA